MYHSKFTLTITTKIWKSKSRGGVLAVKAFVTEARQLLEPTVKIQTSTCMPWHSHRQTHSNCPVVVWMRMPPSPHPRSYIWRWIVGRSERCGLVGSELSKAYARLSLALSVSIFRSVARCHAHLPPCSPLWSRTKPLESVSKSPIKCSILYVALVMVFPHSNKKVRHVCLHKFYELI